jgi:hypothetical protein
MRTLIALALLLTTGCGTLVPTERSNQSAVETADRLSARQSETFRRIVEGTKVESHELPPVKIGGLGNKVELTIENPPAQEFQPYPPVSAPYREETTYSANNQSESKSALDSITKFESTIPLGVKLTLLGLGIVVVIWAIKYALNASAAGKAAFSAADQSLASIIRGLRSEATTSTDPLDLAWLNNKVAELESERGRLKK